MISVEVRERSQVAEARWRALEVASRSGLSELDAARAGLIATEAATNLLKHAGEGEILLGMRLADAGAGMDLVALDRGPGMANVPQCLTDGFSTSGSAGTGLGGIRRQSDRFDLYSVPDEGTVLVASVTARRLACGPPTEVWAEGLIVPASGQAEGGDGWAMRRFGRRLALMICDGLGHGARAATVARRAEERFAWLEGDDLSAWMTDLDQALRDTRGAALALALIDPGAGLLHFSGVGNIAGWLRSSSGQQRTLSTEGIVGRGGRPAKVIDYPFRGELVAVFASDGLASRWDPGRYRGLLTRDPLTIAATLYRDYRRIRDDCVVVVARCDMP